MTNRRKFLQLLSGAAAAPLIAKGDLTPENMQVTTEKVRVKPAKLMYQATAGAWFTAPSANYRFSHADDTETKT